LKRILIVRLGALGDIVHAVPVAAALRRAFPDARIDWLVSGKHRAMLDLVPVVDRRLVISDRTDAREGRSLLAAIRALRRTNYDVALDLQGLIKSAAIARLSGATRVVGFSKRYLREPLARVFYTDAHDPGGEGMHAPSETRHIVHINLGLLGVLGIRTPAVEFPIRATPGDATRQVAERTGGRYAVLNPGAAWPNKRWPPDRLAEVAIALRARHQLPSIVLWGPGEKDLADAVVAQASGAAMAAPPTTIADLAVIVGDATVMVSGDTGPAHIGAALGTPIVGIYGPTRPERNGPWQPADITVSRARECECHHLRRCRRGRMCLLDISTEEVLAAVERRMATGRVSG
jgi:lipopolysaccharide heptosyltransferase I